MRDFVLRNHRQLFQQDLNFLKIFDLSGLIKAIAIARRSIPDIKLTLIGSGDDLQNLKIQVLDNNLEKKMIFMEKLKGEISSLLQRFGIGMATYSKSKLIEYAFTIKLIEYMAAGYPIIATDIRDTESLIRQYKCGILVNDMPDDIAKGVIQLTSNPKQLQLYLNDSKLAAKNFDWSILAKKEIDIIQKYTNKSFNQGA